MTYEEYVEACLDAMIRDKVEKAKGVHFDAAFHADPDHKRRWTDEVMGDDETFAPYLRRFWDKQEALGGEHARHAQDQRERWDREHGFT